MRNGVGKLALGAVVAGALVSMSVPADPAEAASDEVLILGSTVRGGASSVEAQQVSALGLTPVVVDAATWAGLTTADFSSYRAIILGDPDSSSLANLSAAEANVDVWAPAVTGNTLVIGSDPVGHGSGGYELTRRGVDFVVDEVGKTGFYFALSERYDSQPTGSPVAVLEGLRPGAFALGEPTNCYNDVQIVATHPALAGLTDGDLSNWSCSVHAGFERWPADYAVLAIARDLGSAFTASDGTQGLPYILASGDSVKSFPLSLSPSTQSLNTAQTASVTAELLDTTTGAPVAGEPISFRVQSGPNEGTSLSCVTITLFCTTDAAGQVTWAYAGSSLGDDVVQAWLDLDASGTPDPGEPQTTALVRWTIGGKFKYVALGDSFAAGQGIEPYIDPSNKCHRSEHAYSTLVQLPGEPQTTIRQAAADGRPGIEWGFQACSGAVTESLLDDEWKQHRDFIGQLEVEGDREGDRFNDNDLPVDDATDLVTISIGGNDVGFTKVVKACGFNYDCTTTWFRENDGGKLVATTNLPLATRQSGVLLDEYQFQKRGEVAEQLTKIYERIQEQAPNARVLVLGYPHLFPKSTTEQLCPKLAPWSSREQNAIRRWTSEMNQTIADRVNRINDADFQFVPLDEQFDGYEVCGRNGEWINGPTASPNGVRRGDGPVNDQSFHPNRDGMTKGYAAVINALINPGISS